MRFLILMAIYCSSIALNAQQYSSDTTSRRFIKDYIFYQKADTININLESINSNDTIIIEAYIADCGEFGGHNEYITILKNKKNIQANLKSDPPCEFPSLTATPTTLYFASVDL